MEVRKNSENSETILCMMLLVLGIVQYFTKPSMLIIIGLILGVSMIKEMKKKILTGSLIFIGYVFYLNENNYDLSYLLKEFLGIELKSESKKESENDFVKDDYKDEIKNQDISYNTVNKNYYAHQNCNAEPINKKTRINGSKSKYFQRGNPSIHNLKRNHHCQENKIPEIIKGSMHLYANSSQQKKEEESAPFVIAKTKKTRWEQINDLNYEIIEKIKEYLGVDKPQEYIYSIINQIKNGELSLYSNKLEFKFFSGTFGMFENLESVGEYKYQNASFEEIIVHIPHGSVKKFEYLDIKGYQFEEINSDNFIIHIYHDITEEDKKLLKDEIFCEKRRTIFNKYLANHLQPYYKLCVYFDGWYLITEKSVTDIQINLPKNGITMNNEQLNIAYVYHMDLKEKFKLNFFNLMNDYPAHFIPKKYINHYDSYYVRKSTNSNIFMYSHYLNLPNFQLNSVLIPNLENERLVLKVENDVGNVFLNCYSIPNDVIDDIRT
ncbi:hypothetical protein DMUE_2595 [Dictyocoela muelleri]|nr:hypothetical protein DMUE_2595 [Dictyocoela muelleri]